LAGLSQEAKIFAGKMIHKAAEAKDHQKGADRLEKRKIPEGTRDKEKLTAKMQIEIDGAEELSDELAILKQKGIAPGPLGSPMIYYKSVMYFVDKEYVETPTTCGGKLVGKPKTGTVGGCATACENAVGKCIGFQYVPSEYSKGGGGTCIPIGHRVALYNKRVDRFMRMNGDRNTMDASSRRDREDLPDDWNWERFTVVDAGSGYIALHNEKFNRFVRMNNKGDMDLSDVKDIDQLPEDWNWERFRCQSAGKGEIALHSSIHNRFIRMTDGGMQASGPWSDGQSGWQDEMEKRKLPMESGNWTEERFKVVDLGPIKYCRDGKENWRTEQRKTCYDYEYDYEEEHGGYQEDHSFKKMLLQESEEESDNSAGAPQGLCFLFSKLESAFYYTGCGDDEDKKKKKGSAAFLQHTVAAAANDTASYDASDTKCMVKFSRFEGTTLAPDPSGKCKNCLKKIKKADRCFM